MKLILLFVLVQVRTLLGNGPSRSNCQKIGNFAEADLDESINSVPLEIHQVTSPMLCAFKCVAHSKCLSYNYKHQSSSQLHACELLDKTKKDALLAARSGYTHYETGTLSCGGLICHNGGSCMPDCVTEVARCFCTAGFDGANCSVGVSPVVEIQPVAELSLLENETALLDCYSSRAETTKWIKDGYVIDTMSTNRINILLNGTLEIKGFTGADNGKYWCNVLNPTGKSSSQAAEVGLPPPPSASIRGNSYQICSLFYRSFSIEVSLFTKVDAWFKDDVQIDYSTTPGIGIQPNGGLYFNPPRKSHEGQYHFTATNALGTAVSNKATVTVLMACPLLDHPTNGVRKGSRIEGEVASFYCKFKYTLTGSENLECQGDKSWNGAAPTCSADTSGNHPVRLVGFPHDNEGRVEIFSGGKWGAVADTNWDMDDANVVCKQLGFPGAMETIRHMPSDHVRTFLTNVSCAGDEAQLADCPANYGTQYDSSTKTAGVLCLNIRLAGGNDLSGRIEVYTGGRWGTVCDDLWDMKDTAVACRQLGFSHPHSHGNLAGTGDIVLDDVACSGRETSLTQCTHLTASNCGHSEDVSISCHGIRLVGSPSYHEGRVEQLISGQWYTACDDDWDAMEAKVVCNQLGYPGYVKETSAAYFGQGVGGILYDNTACVGDESYLLACSKVDVHNCGHTEDAGVICQAHVRLAGSSNYYEGRVEAYKDGSWGTVCDSNWDIKDADVVCRMMGFNGAMRYYGGAHFGEGTGSIHYDGLQCDGTESRILYCPASPVGSCTHANDAGVRCRVTRLADGATRNQGRVELFKDSTWGSVCDSEFRPDDARQICLDISRSAYSNFWGHTYIYGAGHSLGGFKINDITCDGKEDIILDCPHTDASGSCSAVSAKCNSGTRVYYTAAPWDMRGMVGVFREEGWSLVCANEWDLRDANVACVELGRPGAIEATVLPRTRSESIVRGGFHCEGYETSLDDCRQEPPPVTCTQVAGVVCQNLRLVDGDEPHIGRLEVFMKGGWYAVCFNDWDKRDAHVACVQLGFHAGAKETYSAPEGKVRHSGGAWLKDFYCGGLEKNIFDCPHKSVATACERAEEVWIECHP